MPEPVHFVLHVSHLTYRSGYCITMTGLTLTIVPIVWA